MHRRRTEHEAVRDLAFGFARSPLQDSGLIQSVVAQKPRMAIFGHNCDSACLPPALSLVQCLPSPMLILSLVRKAGGGGGMPIVTESGPPSPAVFRRRVLQVQIVGATAFAYALTPPQTAFAQQ